ncbi:MAG TPA: peptide chain release factor N(5)-glutamine methyltransferase [Gammaproteobacteria bacterium]|nr:peptide chain release factor N(5)-glutamine methyltransferase [Gammaproteobacteria bacterium]
MAALLDLGAAQLSSVTDSPRLEAEILLAHALDRPRSFLHAWPRREVETGARRHYVALVTRRRDGEPVAYLTGRKEFWSLELAVNRHTLIPRPETELLVEQALALLPAGGPCRVVDLGTGSGAIALALARERPAWTVVACERCPRALATARANARTLGLLARVEFRSSDWCSALANDAPYDLICANPPYVREQDPRLEADVLRFEPETALIAGPEGLEDLRAIARQARGHLRPGGWLLLEHGDDQETAVAGLLEKAGYEAIEDLRDYAGRPRLARARWPGP